MSPLDLDPRDEEKRYWKSMDELEGSAPELKAFIEREFPEGASEWDGTVTRRRFLQVMGAGMALAGASGCKPLRRPVANILPYNKMPESLVPGVAQHYATTQAISGDAVGLVVESHEGRPTKVEGNPKHPSSLGGTHRFHQASILGLYDPERSRLPLKKGMTSDWAAFWQEAKGWQAAWQANQGQGVAFLSNYNASPTFAALRAEFLAKYPKARWYFYEATPRDKAIAGTRMVTGQPLEPKYMLDRATRIVSFDADFLDSEPGSLAMAKAYAAARNPEKGEAMARHYQVESRYSITGGAADHRLRVAPSRIPAALIAFAKELEALGANFKALGFDLGALPASKVSDTAWLKAAAADCWAEAGRSVVLAGRYQPATAHALALACNMVLQGAGATVEYLPSSFHGLNGGTLSAPPSYGMNDLLSLGHALGAGEIQTLICLESNPAFTAPGDFKMASRLAKVSNLVHLGLERDETADLSGWHLPASHYLESWGDAVAYDGTASIAQPLIEPLYETLSPLEFLAKLLGKSEKAMDLVKGRWASEAGGMGFEKAWRRWLHDGLVEAKASVPVAPVPVAGVQSRIGMDLPKGGEGLEVVFREHANMLDGRNANNAWLQELPEPISKLTWDNAVFVSPAKAKELGLHGLLNKEDTGTTLADYKKRPGVVLKVNGAEVEALAWVQPGLPDDTILFHFGYGRTKTGKVGTGTGFDAFALMAGVDPYVATGALVSASSRLFEAACTQDHWSIMGRPIVREANLKEYHHNEEEAFSEEKWNEHPPEKNLWGQEDVGTYDFSKGMQWGMVVDFNSCTGCSACVVACQAENNIPTVGKEQVMRGREMHWIRMDRYFSGDVDDPQLIFQAMACQQCENAPCEEVCPVAATTHTHEGLNDMVYNRCVGTRYCSNNCPYKVRRFNFFNYTNKYSETQKMAQNPDVTVRYRGVMEKCTYCVQRINRARIDAKNRGSEVIADGAITPACAQACASNAITFGDINDPGSRVAMLKKHPRNYGVLRDINTKPRTSYLGRVRNPNPALA